MAKQPAKGRKTPAKSQKAALSAAKASESKSETASVVDAIPAEVHAIPSTEAPKTPEDAPKPVVDNVAPPAARTLPSQQSNSMLPLVLGGLIAGVIGFGVATFTAPAPDDAIANQVAAQASALAGLQSDVTAIDLGGVEAAQTEITGQLETLSASMADITARLVALEARPAGVALAGDMSGVSSEMDALRAQIAEMTGAAQTELEEARAAAASIEENAAAAARNAAGRAALARVQTALESGAPIGAALGDLEDATGGNAPAALIAVQDGVPTLASLQDQFPDVARAALASARSEGVAGEEATGIGAFLRNQFDVRSTTPQEGDGADPVLSRAEAAVRTGRLADALAEISALPEVARGEMSEWLAQAEARASAIAAVDILLTTLSDN